MALIVIGSIALVLGVSGVVIQLITSPSMRSGASVVAFLVLGLVMVLLGADSLRRAKK